jgi:hypothetical protein
MKLLVAIGAVLVIGAVALVLMMSKTDDPPVGQKSIPRPAGQGSSVTVTSTDRGAPPVLPNGSAVATAGSDQTREYMVGDVKIRDHRTGDHKPMDIPPNIHPANARALPSELTQDISQQVKRQLFACAKDLLPKEARGTKPKLEGTLSVAIKDHKLAITGLDSQIRDVDEASASALKQCVEQKSASFTSSAPKEADLDNYTIGLTFAIP